MICKYCGGFGAVSHIHGGEDPCDPCNGTGELEKDPIDILKEQVEYWKRETGRRKHSRQYTRIEPTLD